MPRWHPHALSHSALYCCKTNANKVKVKIYSIVRVQTDAVPEGAGLEAGGHGEDATSSRRVAPPPPTTARSLHGLHGTSRLPLHGT